MPAPIPPEEGPFDDPPPLNDRPWVYRGLGAFLLLPGGVMAWVCASVLASAAKYPGQDLALCVGVVFPLAIMCCGFGISLIAGASNPKATLMGSSAWIAVGLWFAGLQLVLIISCVVHRTWPGGRGFLGCAVMCGFCFGIGIHQRRKAREHRQVTVR